jgi:predicted MFS family arabinose efflux permease
MAAPADEPAAPGAPSAPALRGLIAVLSVGIFVTGFGWPGIIGRLPFTLLLKNHLHMPAQQVAKFWAIATFAWYIKPLVGFICDAYPLFGTRRRSYLLLGTALSVFFWLTFAFAPREYGSLVVVMTLLNLAMVTVSVVVGGLQVEVSQRHGATGRLASLRTAIEGVMDLAGGPVGGLLAVCAFGWTAAAGAAVMLSFLPVVARFYPEARGSRTNTEVWTIARSHLRVIVRSRAMWGAAGLLFLVYLAPGMQTAMVYYQTDVLKLDPRFIGLLQTLQGAGGILGAATYAYLCRRVTLKVSLIVGIVLNAASALFYLRYDSAVAAAVIDTSAAYLTILGTMPLYDLAARATPSGIESFGFSLMMSIRNIAIFAISNYAGSYLYDRVGFKPLVWINAGSSAAVLLFVPLLPAALLAAREGDRGTTR